MIFLPIFVFPEIVQLLTQFTIFLLLGFAYKNILIRNDLPDFFVAFGGCAVVLFWGFLLIPLLIECIGWLLEALFL